MVPQLLDIVGTSYPSEENSMPESILNEFLVEQIQDLYSAEKQLVKALLKLAKAATNEKLVEAFRAHLEVTKEHVSRIEKVFSILGKPARAKTCKGMQGLIEEGAEAIEELDGPELDLALIAGAQRVEHYEISAYGTVRTVAEQLNLSQAVELLSETENEEKEADSELSEIAMEIYGSLPDDEEREEEESTQRSSGKPRKTVMAKRARA